MSGVALPERPMPLDVEIRKVIFLREGDEERVLPSLVVLERANEKIVEQISNTKCGFLDFIKRIT